MQTLRNVFVAATETGQAGMLLMLFNDCPVQAQEPMQLRQPTPARRAAAQIAGIAGWRYSEGSPIEPKERLAQHIRDACVDRV
jgi:hypothetical protein